MTEREIKLALYGLGPNDLPVSKKNHGTTRRRHTRYATVHTTTVTQVPQANSTITTTPRQRTEQHEKRRRKPTMLSAIDRLRLIRDR